MSLYCAVHAVAVANPEELFQIWCRVEELEQDGGFLSATADEWKEAIFWVMVERELLPEDVLPVLVC